MRFGQNEEEFKKDPRNQTSSGDFMRTPKDGDQQFQILQEPDEWTWFLDHFNPGGFSFPCTKDDSCPGCASDNEKMKKQSRKAAFNVKEGDFVNVYKVPPALADKLKLRYDRLGTITDREYTITRYKTSGDRYEYDVEGNLPNEFDVNSVKDKLKDVESMLEQAFIDATSGGGSKNSAKVKQKDEKTEKAPAEDPPWATSDSEAKKSETTYDEAELRSMSMVKLIGIMGKEGIDAGDCPKEDPTVDDLVDWMLEKQSA